MSGDHIDCQGHVLEEQRGGTFVVDAEIGTTRRRVLARISGRLHCHRIRIVPGDLVQLKLDPYTMQRGIITYRGPKERTP